MLLPLKSKKGPRAVLQRHQGAMYSLRRYRLIIVRNNGVLVTADAENQTTTRYRQVNGFWMNLRQRRDHDSPS